MAITVHRSSPVAHLPLILGRLRTLDVAVIIDGMLPPNPAPVLSGGRGVEALMLVMLDGHHALYTVGSRLAERGMCPLLQAGLARTALHDYRLGQSLDALFAANLTRVFGAVALRALAVDAIPTPWVHQETTITLSGAYAAAAHPDSQAPQALAGPVPPRPADGHSQEGHDALKPVLLSLGVSSDGGLPRRLGVREGNTSESTETSVALEACLALGLEGGRGIVADSKAYGKRTRGWCLEKRGGLITLVPRTCAVRQALDARGSQQGALPVWLEKPGRTRQASPRRWHGQSVVRPVEVEYRDGRVALEARRFVIVPSNQLAQQAALTSAKAQTQEAARVAEHIRRVEARRFACAADAETALAADEGRGQGRRGRRPQPWRYHALRYRVETCQQRKTWARRGRPPKAAQPQAEIYSRVGVEGTALEQAKDEQGWCVWATTVGGEGCSDTEVLQAYQEQHTTVEPGLRWIKNPAAITPGWLEKPARIATLAMLTVLGWLVSALIQRQVRRYRRHHGQPLPGNKGATAIPTAAVALSLFVQVMMVQLEVDKMVSLHVYGLQDDHLTICEALGIDRVWYESPPTGQNKPMSAPPP